MSPRIGRKERLASRETKRATSELQKGLVVTDSFFKTYAACLIYFSTM